MSNANSAIVRDARRPATGSQTAKQSEPPNKTQPKASNAACGFAIREERPGLRPSHPYFKAVNACTKVALSLTRSPEGLKSLIKIGTRSLAKIKPEHRRVCDTADRLPGWASTFNGQLSQKFVSIALSDEIESNAQFIECDWTRMGKEWDPANAGVIWLNRFVRCHLFRVPIPLPQRALSTDQTLCKAVESMVRAMEGTDKVHKEAYNSFLFDMGLAIARALSVCFFYSVVSSKMAACFGPDEEDGVEEIWETSTLNGSTGSFEQAGHVLGPRQAGELWHVQERTGTARRIRLPDLASQIPDSRLHRRPQIARWTCC